MPEYNPLVGWTSDDGSLIGWGGQNAGGASNGYTGSVNTAADFGHALAWGGGAVLGGPIGAVLGATNLLVGANTGTIPGTLNTGRQLLQSLGWMDPSPSVAGPVSNDLTAGEFGGKMGEATSSMGGDAQDLAGNDRGSNGDRTAEARGFAMGGFTGGVEGQPRGEVHGQELVLSAPAVRALGPVANELATVNALATRQGMPRTWAEMIQMHHPEAWG